MIRCVRQPDIDTITSIYNHYVRETTATFEEEVIDSQEMAKRVNTVLQMQLPWLVAEYDERIVGFAYAKFWHTRSAYRYTVEITIYMSPSSDGKGIGTALYQALFTQLRQLGIHCAIAVITLPNCKSIAIHEKFSMEKSGHFKEVGVKFGQWLDVGYWTVHLNNKADAKS